MTNKAELDNRFKFHSVTDQITKDSHEAIRDYCLQTAEFLDGLLPEGREKSLAITKLEKVMFWANAAIARSNKPYSTSLPDFGVTKDSDTPKER
jgi:hypothetical protein